MSPEGAIFVPFPPKPGTNMLHPLPPPQSLNLSIVVKLAPAAQVIVAAANHIAVAMAVAAAVTAKFPTLASSPRLSCP